MGILALYVMSTSSLANLRQAAQITRIGGFDVILSNAEGELSYLSMQVLATLGYLIDLGLVDIQTAPVMSLELLQKKKPSIARSIPLSFSTQTRCSLKQSSCRLSMDIVVKDSLDPFKELQQRILLSRP